jgi:hypothetical protein
MKPYFYFSALTLLSIAGNLSAAAVTGGTVATHTSPNKIEESCVILEQMPGGEYSSKDSKEEQTYCKIDLYSKNIAMCPKIWSTSPGTIIYQLYAGPYKGKATKFEASVCSRGKSAVNYTTGKHLKFKNTMNMKGTSGTFSTASLLYYHFSRYFDTHIHVPVAVQRTMDNKAHLKRVTHRGVKLASKNRKMIHAAWLDMQKVQQKPELYKPTEELFTADRKQIYGVLLHSPGKRYGVLMNGTRKSGWGAGQNNDFQKTPPFLALRSSQPLKKAIREGIEEAEKDPIIKKAIKSEISDQQMVYWMQDLTEITLLDYIFSQQDRVGNIDFEEYWYWKKGSSVRKKHARTKTPAKNLAKHKPLRIQETFLNDNDAGSRNSYSNFTKKTKMLEKIRHFNPDTYRQLIKLDKDFSSKGKLYAYVKDSFGLNEKQFQQIVTNTHEATAILKESCKAKKLRFDLDPDKFFAKKSSREKRLNCDKP